MATCSPQKYFRALLGGVGQNLGMIRSKRFYSKPDPSQADPVGESFNTASLKKSLESQPAASSDSMGKNSVQKKPMAVTPTPPNPTSANAVAANNMRAMLKLRHEEVSQRYGAEDESKVSSLITAMRLGDSRDISTYAGTVMGHLKPLLGRRRTFYRMMLLQYADILSSYAAMIKNSNDDKKDQEEALALIKQTRTSVKRDLQLMAKDRELITGVLDAFAPMAMAVKPGILSGIRGNNDHKNLSSDLMASEPLLQTDDFGVAKFDVSDKILTEIQQEIARKARIMTFSINHPAIALMPQTKDLTMVELLAGRIKDDLEQRDVEDGPQYDRRHSQRWRMHKADLDANTFNRADAQPGSRLPQKVTFSYDKNYVLSEQREFAYAKAYLHHAVFKPFTVAAQGDAATGIKIRNTSELMTGQALVSSVAEQTKTFVDKYLQSYQVLLQYVLTLSTLSREVARTEVNDLAEALQLAVQVR